MQTVLVGFQCDPALKAEIVAAASPLTVSQYLRSALVEKLRRDGFRVSLAMAEAPSRLGKGGPKQNEEDTLRTSDSGPMAAIDPSQKRETKYGAPRKTQPKKSRS